MTTIQISNLDSIREAAKTFIAAMDDRTVFAFHGPMDVVAARSPVDRQLKFFDYATKTFVAASTVLAE